MPYAGQRARAAGTAVGAHGAAAAGARAAKTANEGFAIGSLSALAHQSQAHGLTLSRVSALHCTLQLGRCHRTHSTHDGDVLIDVRDVSESGSQYADVR